MNVLKMLPVILLASCLLVAETAPAQEKINSAFGMTLGAVFDPANAIGTAALTDGTPMYQFNASMPFRSFTEYYVLITPKTHKIYGIWGIGAIENDPTCKKEQELLLAMLEQKYGKKEKDDLLSAFYDFRMISQGNRSVVTKCSGFMDVTIEVRYKDTTLEKLADSERISLESKRVDSSGL